MTRRRGNLLRRLGPLLAIAISIVSVGLVAADLTISGMLNSILKVYGPSIITAASLAIVGGFIAARRPRHPIGWIMLFIAFTQALVEFSAGYARAGVLLHGGSLPLAEIAAWLSEWMWTPGLGMLATFLLLLFPTGHLPSPRWRWLARVTAVTLTIAVTLIAVGTWPERVTRLARMLSGEATNSAPPPGPLQIIFPILVVVLAGCMFASLASLVVRYRRASGDERHQLKWVAYATVLLVIAIASDFITPVTDGTVPITDVPRTFLVIFFPASIAIAIFRYRLYDIDVVISRTLVYGSLAAFITAVYVGIVVGVGALIGSGGQPNLVLSIIATAVVAVAFQPVRDRLNKVANRLVYGKRATPYEVLSQFSERVAETYAADEALPRMARVLAEGTGAEHAEVWLRAGSELHPAANWPSTYGAAHAEERVQVQGQLLPELPAETAMPVRHQGELLGALTVTKRAGESLTPVEEKLLADLAAQAGLVLKNVGLTAELLARLDDLRASRQRLVAAQDEERRRLERNLHDGAQQNLVALKVKLGLAEMLADKDPQKAQTILAELKGDTDEALETLRDLARGIYPPLLADKGLAAALEAQARKATVPVEVSVDSVGRYSQEVEAAVYFCVLEALQNIQKYAQASRARVRLSQTDGAVTFEVEDDGKGFEPATAKRGAGMTNMADRLDALGGRIELDSQPGAGARLRGTIPVAEAVPA
ncbi:MAG TPA: histidine kinase [Candidatus Dormibacteraeota bacterium]|jgi:signal transduction histidine kinase|nr:histidine kinase [Candidatus Dormibacteraeota bacterium]